jgi:hypothetical protein
MVIDSPTITEWTANRRDILARHSQQYPHPGPVVHEMQILHVFSSLIDSLVYSNRVFFGLLSG